MKAVAKAPPDLLCENSQVELARFPWGNSSCRAPALRTDHTALSGFPSVTPEPDQVHWNLELEDLEREFPT